MWVTHEFAYILCFIMIDSPRDSNSPEDSGMEAALGLGELAGLTVNNDAESIGYEVKQKVLNSCIFYLLFYSIDCVI